MKRIVVSVMAVVPSRTGGAADRCLPDTAAEASVPTTGLARNVLAAVAGRGTRPDRIDAFIRVEPACLLRAPDVTVH
jgi:hypothetical protein